MSPADDTPRWQGHSHQEIWDMVQAGSGPGVSQYAQGRWNATWFTMHVIEARLSAAIADAGSGWEGAAADATRAGVTPLGHWALQGAEQAQATAKTLDAQYDYAAYTREQMPPVSKPDLATTAPPDTGFTAMFVKDWQADDQVRDNEAQRARELMQTYTENTYGGLPGITGWSPPPAVVLDDGSGASAPGGAQAGSGVVTAGVPAGIGAAGGGVQPHAPGGAYGSAAAPSAGGGPGSVGAPPAPGTLGQAGAPSVTGGPGSAGFGGAGSASTPGAGAIPPGAAFRPDRPGPFRPDPAAAAPLGPFSNGSGGGQAGTGPAGRNGGAPAGGSVPWGGYGSRAGYGTGAGYGRAAGNPPGSSAGAGSGSPGRGSGWGAQPDPLPTPARPDRGSPERPFPSSAPPPGEAARPGRPAGQPGMMPMGAGGGAGGGGREHRRPAYLIEDADVFSDHRWVTPHIINAPYPEDHHA